VDALERAIEVLISQAYNKPRAMTILEHMAKITLRKKRVSAACPQQTAEQDGASAVDAYEFQSQNVIDFMEALEKKHWQRSLKPSKEVKEDEANQAPSLKR